MLRHISTTRCLSSMTKAIRRAHGPDAADAYRQAAMACGSYDELLAHAMATVEVD